MVKKKLQGQVAIVTGAGRGIGAGVAERLVVAGARVVLTARTAEEVEKVGGRLRGVGGQAIAVPGDITEPDSVEEVVESALDQFGRVDILVNNAGVIWPVDELVDVDADEWIYNIYTNLIGPFVLTRTVLPLMLEQGSGRIVNVSSSAAHVPTMGMSAYCAAKAGLNMWTRVLALELEGRGVTANVFDPGRVDTAMQEDIRSIDTEDSRLDFSSWHRSKAENRLATPSSVADLIYWLVGPWSRQRNGEVFSADDQDWVQQVWQDLG